jgi:hypothetical protein
MSHGVISLGGNKKCGQLQKQNSPEPDKGAKLENYNRCLIGTLQTLYTEPAN